MQLDDLNVLDAPAAEQALLQCCGSRRWAREMAGMRPFADAAATSAAADRVFDTLDRADWLEAFAAHPQIGAGGAGGARAAAGADAKGKAGGAGAASRAAAMSLQEQSLVAHAPDAVRRRLSDLNRDYQARFGYIFIVCATGKSGDEMLELLERRIGNDPATELPIAAAEQRKITHLRLNRLLDASGT